MEKERKKTPVIVQRCFLFSFLYLFLILLDDDFVPVPVVAVTVTNAVVVCHHHHYHHHYHRHGDDSVRCGTRGQRSHQPETRFLSLSEHPAGFLVPCLCGSVAVA